MRIQVFGDVHRNLLAVQAAVKVENPDLMLFVGDIEDDGPWFDDFPIPSIIVKGNHDKRTPRPWNETMGLFDLGWFGRVEYNDTAFVGVGGVPGTSKIYHWGKNGALDELAKVRRCDILISHETCSPFIKKLLSGKKKDVGNRKLARECARIRPRFHVSGHHHRFKQEVINGVEHLRLGRAAEGYGMIVGGQAWLVEYGDDGLWTT